MPPQAGVVLVGDAIHAFPPDIGQGVNSALSDVVMLGEALDGADGGDGPMAKLRDALSARRLPSTRLHGWTRP